MSINKVVISGNLTRDPELRATASGTKVLAIGLAVNERRKNPQTGEWEDAPNFVDCTMFGNRAESVSQFLRKGSKVCVEGRLHYSSWERDGQKRSKLEVMVDDIELMQQAQQQVRDINPSKPACAVPQQQMYGYAPQPVYAPQAVPQPAYAPPAPVQPVYQPPLKQQAATAYDEEIPF